MKGTQNEDYLRKLISDLDAPEFARRQCFLRSIKEMAISKCNFRFASTFQIKIIIVIIIVIVVIVFVVIIVVVTTSY